MESLVSASEGAMGSLLVKLGSLLSDQYKLLTRVKDEAVLLKAELESMHAFLKTMSAVEDHDAQTRCWMKEVRELSYDIEDSVNEFILRDDHERNNRCKPSGLRGHMERAMNLLNSIKMRHRIAIEIEGLKTRVLQASDRRSRYKVDDSVKSKPGTMGVDPRLLALYADVADLVGIDGPRDELVDLLTGKDVMLQNRLKVVSIVGFGGLGKTTLAGEVYRKIEGQFQCQAFVSMSQKPDMKKILINIFSQISQKERIGIEAWNEQQLIDALRKFLKDKRYFIVIDDIWSASAWRTIKCALLENDCSSRILTTTRIATVAKSCCSSQHDFVYEINPLSTIESESLFFNRAFGPEGRCPHHLKEICDEILKKCGGMPLAIITIASLLADKASNKEEWVRVRNSVCSAVGKSSNFEEMKKILLLSYNNLPYHLKSCLLYLSVFPEDYVIRRDQLVKRWIAKGFINTDVEQDLEEIGQCYFADLINRGLIQPVGIQYDGQPDACRVHDMILDLIISKSAEENFVAFLGDQNHKLAQQDKVCRLSIDCHAHRHIMLPPMTVASHVRSLTIFGSADQIPPPSNFRFLRVLDLESMDQLEDKYLKHIGKLFQLKYLRLSVRRIAALPKQLGDLQQLETLDLRGTLVNKLPTSIIKLRRLACLLVDGLELPEGVGNMRALQELSFVEINQHTSASSLQELGSLSRLKILGMNCCFSIYTDDLVMSLSKLGTFSLRSLKVQINSCCFMTPLFSSWSPAHLLQEFQMTTDYYFPKIPKWISSLYHLSYLDININLVEESVFQILGKLPALAFLWISSKVATTRVRLTIGSGKFLCLKEFNFTCWNSRKGLAFEAGAMPKLEKLHIPYDACDARSVFGDFDFGIQHLSSVKHLHVEIICYGAKVGVVEALVHAIRNAAGHLPILSTFQVRRWGSSDMVNDGEQQAEEPEISSNN